MIDIDDHVRNRPLESNHPLTEALHFYGDLVTNLNPTAHSGAAKLWLLQSGGADMGGEQSPLNVSFSAAEWTLSGGPSITKSLNRNHYTGYLVANNLKAYIDVCLSLCRRILDKTNESDPNDFQGKYFPTSNAFYACFYPSPMVVDKMLIAIAQFARTEHPNIVDRDRTTALASMEVSLFTELETIVRQGGRGMNYKADRHSLRTFFETVEKICSYPTYDYKKYLLPLYRSITYLTRLLHGEVAPINYNSLGNAIGQRRVNLRISDDTVACVPAPSYELLKTFEEPETPIISNKAWQYIDRMTAVYMSDQQ